jgi:hypothetical protein
MASIIAPRGPVRIDQTGTSLPIRTAPAPPGTTFRSRPHPAHFRETPSAPATGFHPVPDIPDYLRDGGELEVAQQMANHESARTTGLYDRRNDQVPLKEASRARSSPATTFSR